MAKKAPATARRQSRRSSTAARSTRGSGKSTGLAPVRWGIPLGTMNYAGIALGVVVIVIGYLLMATGIPEDPANNEGIWNNAKAVSIAPILLTLGYCVIIPIAIFFRPKKNVMMEEAEAATNGAEA